MATKPASPKRVVANRANAVKSTGPRSAEGKARSAQNARKHGFTAASFAVVRLEDLQILENLRADAIDVYRPVNSQELFAVERIALAQLTLQRAAILEAGLHTAAMNQTIRYEDTLPANLISASLTTDFEVAQHQNRALCLAEGFQRLVGRSDSWKLLLRYQAQSERMYRRAIEEFDRLKALREELPNEPIEPPEPEEVEFIDPVATPWSPAMTEFHPLQFRSDPGPAPASPPAPPRSGQ